jgi:hypothetical protein
MELRRGAVSAPPGGQGLCRSSSAMVPNDMPDCRKRLAKVCRRSRQRKSLIPAARTAAGNQCAFTFSVTPTAFRTTRPAPAARNPDRAEGFGGYRRGSAAASPGRRPLGECGWTQVCKTLRSTIRGLVLDLSTQPAQYSLPRAIPLTNRRLRRITSAELSADRTAPKAL